MKNSKFEQSLVASATAKQLAEMRTIQSQSEPEFKVGDRVWNSRHKI